MLIQSELRKRDISPKTKENVYTSVLHYTVLWVESQMWRTNRSRNRLPLSTERNSPTRSWNWNKDKVWTADWSRYVFPGTMEWICIVRMEYCLQNHGKILCSLRSRFLHVLHTCKGAFGRTDWQHGPDLQIEVQRWPSTHTVGLRRPESQMGGVGGIYNGWEI